MRTSLLTSVIGRQTEAEATAWVAPLLRPASGSEAHACCCTAPPLYQVVVPPGADRRPTELLLCGHHLRRSLDALATIGAWIYGVDGRLLDSCT